MMSFIQLMTYGSLRRLKDVSGGHKIWFLGYKYHIYQRRIPKSFSIGCILGVSQDVFEHKLT